jgi:WD40 repeat protein
VFHPSDQVIATGDAGGRVKLWYFTKRARDVKPKESLSLSANEENVATTYMHWHAHPVRSLVFAVDGHYVFSGGLEGVLVSWHVNSGLALLNFLSLSFPVCANQQKKAVRISFRAWELRSSLSCSRQTRSDSASR